MTSRRRFSVLLLILLALGAVVAGCGDDDGGGGGGDSLSKEEFVEAGDRICSEADSAADGVDQPSGVSEIPAYVDEVVPPLEKARDDFGDLEPEDDEGREIRDQLIERVGKGVDLLNELKDIAENDGSEEQIAAKFQEFSELDDDEADKRARDYGFEKCGSE